MLKAPEPQATAIDAVRQNDGISQHYARDRLHIRIMYLGPALPPVRVTQIIGILDGFVFDPFTLSLDRHKDCAMPVRTGARQIRQLRQQLIARLAAHGLHYTLESHPHMTLAYGKHATKMPMHHIPPISWLAEEVLLIQSGSGQHHCRAKIPLLRRQFLLFG